IKNDIRTSLCVMSQFLLRVNVFTEHFARDTDAHKPIETSINPLTVQLRPEFVFRLDKVFDFHLLELTRTEDKITRSNLVTKCLTNLRDTKWDLHPPGINYVAI